MKIFEFNPVLYPTRLWVCKSGTTIDELDEVFGVLCEDNTIESFKDNLQLPQFGDSATTYIVGHKKLGLKGCLVYLNREVTVGSLAHEASHCTDWIFDEIDDAPKERLYESGEPRAYYLQWVMECLWKVKQGKVK